MTTSLHLHLRLATPADAAAIRELTLTAYRPWVPIVGREPSPMTEDYDAAVRTDRFDLADQAGELVALIQTRREADHLLIVNIAVDPPRHGQGIGRQLLAHAEDLARAEGLTTLWLYTNAKMSRNIALYRRFGYVIDREEPSPLGGVVVHMVKQLEVAPRVLFLPGAGADPAFWRPLGDRLPAAWPKHYFGWPGLGDQPPDPAVSSIGDLIALVEAELAPGPVDLVAQSMGGVVAMGVALRNPGLIRRLVLTATSGGVDVADLTRFDWRANYRREYPRAAPWITEERLDFTARIPSITAPSLLLWGDADPISPAAVGERLASLLPDARLHVVAGADHDLAQTHAAELAPRVAAHLGLP